MQRRRMIPPETIEEIKEKNDIVSVVERYVHLTKKSSINMFGLCPFHSEKTPSFSVSPSKQIFYCFGCHKGGDVVTFIMEIEKLEYYDTLKYLAERAGVPLPEFDDAEYRQRSDQRKLLIQINTEAARYYYKNLISDAGKSARDYFARRKLDISTCRKFGLGYALDSWDGLLNHLKAKGYSDDYILMSGLIKKRSGSDSKSLGYDLFRNRIIFPIFDQMGKIIAFGGRVLDDSMPKYINSPETPLYTKGKHLYAFNIAKKSKAKKLLVVEGYMDVLSVYQAGVDYVVAALGTALTDQQAMILRNYSEQVVISFDGDIAGMQATARGLEILKKKGCEVFVLQIPDAKDPDEFIKQNGPERFRALIDKALPLMEYKLKRAYEMSINDEKLDKLKYQELVCDVLAEENNIVVREIYAGQVSEHLGVSPDNVLTETQRRIRMKNKESKPVANLHPYTKERENQAVLDDDEQDDIATIDEINLLCVLAYSDTVYKFLEEDLLLSDFSNGVMQEVTVQALKLAAQNKLSTNSLLTLGADHIVNGNKLSQLLASGCIKTGDIKDSTEAKNEASRLNAKIRTKRLLKEKGEAVDILTNANSDEHEIKKAKERISKLSNELNKYREKQ